MEMVRDSAQLFIRGQIHSFYLDMSRSIPISSSTNFESTLTQQSSFSIQHDLASGGRAEVGVLHQSKGVSITSNTIRGYVPILYQTVEGGDVNEAYILCDIVNRADCSPLVDERIEPTDPDFPSKWMEDSSFLQNKHVTIAPIPKE